MTGKAGAVKEDGRRFIAVEGELGGFEILDDEARRFVALEGALGGFAVLATAEADHDKPPFARADDEDDHYYGAWSGGKKSEGGHPEGEGKDETEGGGHWGPFLPIFESDILAKQRDIPLMRQVEWAQTFDKDGNPIGLPMKGAKASCRIPQEQLQAGGLVSHYHPPSVVNPKAPEAVTLSHRDIELALNDKMSIRAFGPNGSWMELRNNGYPYNGARFKSAFARLKRESEARLQYAQEHYGEDPNLYHEVADDWNNEYGRNVLKAVAQMNTGKYPGTQKGMLEIITGKGKP